MITKKNILNLFTYFLMGYCAYGQIQINFPPQNETSIIVSPEINNLVEARMQHYGSSSYKIQLFYGSLEDAHTTLKKFKFNFENWEGSIKYETPNYKVWVGDYRNKIDADRALLKINEKFPGAFVFENK